MSGDGRAGVADDDWFSFAMGEFTARFPRDRRFATNHMWGSDQGDSRWRFGLTAYAVRLLQDVYFLDWIVEPSQPISTRANIGSIESKKAESDLFAPITGTLAAINEAVIEDPSLINAEPYDGGWLIEIEAVSDPMGSSDSGDRPVLLTPDQYADHLKEAWDVAQRTIKGQANH